MPYLRVVFSLALIGALAAGLGWTYYFGPYYWDQFKMSDVVRASASTWANLGRMQGEAKLREELMQRNIGDYFVYTDVCEFSEQNALKTVACDWEIVVEPPLVGKRRLRLSAHASADRDGRLMDD